MKQATFFYNIPLDEGKFNVDKNFYQGQLVPIEEILSGREVVLAPLRTPGSEIIAVNS